jgi:TolB protein
MTVSTSPQPRRSFLLAVIEEARQRARRRRARYVLLALLLAAAGAAAYSSFNHGDGGGASLARTLQRIDVAPSAPLRRNGALTITDARVNANQQGPAGWYVISTVDKLGRLHKLVRCPKRVGWCGELVSIDWSPDGRRLAFTVTSFNLVNPYNGLHVVTLRTGRDIQIVSDGPYRNLDWSPDGRRLAYTTNGGIAVINADGSSRKVLRSPKDRSDRSPSWSPDGAWIAFASSGPHGNPGIWAMRADGSERRQLVRSGATPAWSPDGSRIAFHAPRAQIEFVSPNGTLLSPRLPFRRGASVGINGTPVWSPDGTKIAMSSRRYGTYVMNADGTELRRLTPRAAGLSTGQARPAWRPVSR